MKKIRNITSGIAGLIWQLTNLVFLVEIAFLIMLTGNGLGLITIPIVFICSNILSIPIHLVLKWSLKKIQKSRSIISKKYFLLILTCLLSTLAYGILFSLFVVDNINERLTPTAYATLSLFAPSLIAIAFLHKKINIYFLTTKNESIMEHNQFHNDEDFNASSNRNSVVRESAQSTLNQPSDFSSSKTLMKGLITAGMSLGMLIPTAFVSSLVNEREKRQDTVVDEVTSGWSNPQTLSN